MDYVHTQPCQIQRERSHGGHSRRRGRHLYKSGEKNSKDPYDRFEAWFKPTGTDLVSSVIKAEGKSNLTSFDTLGFRSVNINSQVLVSVDSLRVAEVPEPGRVVLMGLALADFAAARRRERG